MPEDPTIISIPAKEMQECFAGILLREGFTHERALECAEIFTNSSVDGIYTHGVNRFPRFVQYIKRGFVKVHAKPSLESKYGGIEQYNGNSGPGMLNAIYATETAMGLAQQHVSPSD